MQVSSRLRETLLFLRTCRFVYTKHPLSEATLSRAQPSPAQRSQPEQSKNLQHKLNSRLVYAKHHFFSDGSLGGTAGFCKSVFCRRETLTSTEKLTPSQTKCPLLKSSSCLTKRNRIGANTFIIGLRVAAVRKPRAAQVKRVTPSLQPTSGTQLSTPIVTKISMGVCPWLWLWPWLRPRPSQDKRETPIYMGEST